MARATDTVVVRPSNNIYTVLVIVATLVVFFGLIVLFLRANTLFENGLL